MKLILFISVRHTVYIDVNDVKFQDIDFVMIDKKKSVDVLYLKAIHVVQIFSWIDYLLWITSKENEVIFESFLVFVHCCDI